VAKGLLDATATGAEHNFFPRGKGIDSAHSMTGWWDGLLLMNLPQIGHFRLILFHLRESIYFHL